MNLKEKIKASWQKSNREYKEYTDTELAKKFKEEKHTPLFPLFLCFVATGFFISSILVDKSIIDGVAGNALLAVFISVVTFLLVVTIDVQHQRLEIYNEIRIREAIKEMKNNGA